MKRIDLYKELVPDSLLHFKGLSDREISKLVERWDMETRNAIDDDLKETTRLRTLDHQREQAQRFGYTWEDDED